VFDKVKEMQDADLREIVQASENPEKTIISLSDQHSKLVSQKEQEYWERCRFCQCGADSILECDCDTKKKWRYMERTNRKINKELGKTSFTILTLAFEYDVKLGKSESFSNKNGDSSD